MESAIQFVEWNPMGGVFVVHPALNGRLVIGVRGVPQVEEESRYFRAFLLRERGQFCL